jgi:hypothetical protein
MLHSASVTRVPPIAVVAALAAFATAACHPVRKRGRSGGSDSGAVTLAVLPTESDRFPGVAKAITESLEDAEVPGIDRKEMASVSLEVAQLSIECIQRTSACYAKVGKSMAANRLLFAEIAAADRKRFKVTVTLFDVDTRKPRTAHRVFASEQEASANIGELVSEATR